jgi:hypothetical protein
MGLFIAQKKNLLLLKEQQDFAIKQSSGFHIKLMGL